MRPPPHFHRGNTGRSRSFLLYGKCYKAPWGYGPPIPTTAGPQAPGHRPYPSPRPRWCKRSPAPPSDPQNLPPVPGGPNLRQKTAGSDWPSHHPFPGRRLVPFSSPPRPIISPLLSGRKLLPKLHWIPRLIALRTRTSEVKSFPLCLPSSSVPSGTAGRLNPRLSTVS